MRKLTVRIKETSGVDRYDDMNAGIAKANTLLKECVVALKKADRKSVV